MKKNLRMLALGLLISAAILFVFDLFTGVSASGSKEKDESKLWKTKYEALVSKEELKRKEAEEAKRKIAEKKKKKENQIKKFMLTLVKGDPSSKAAQELEAHGIIKSAGEFNEYLRKNDYEKYIRDGKYDLTSEMNYEQIAKKLVHK